MTESAQLSHINRELDQIHAAVKDSNAKLDSAIKTFSSYHSRLAAVEQAQSVEPVDHAPAIVTIRETISSHATMLKLLGAGLLFVGGIVAQHLAFH